MLHCLNFVALPLHRSLDWHHTASALLARAFLSPENRNRQEPLPDSALINGRGSCLIDCAQPPPRFVTTVQSGRRHLLRIINTSGMLPFTISIDNHAMTILYGQHKRLQRSPSATRGNVHKPLLCCCTCRCAVTLKLTNCADLLFDLFPRRVVCIGHYQWTVCLTSR